MKHKTDKTARILRYNSATGILEPKISQTVSEYSPLHYRI